MDDRLFWDLMCLMMVSDPWPLEEEQHTRIQQMLDAEAWKRGHENWIVAYLELNPNRVR